ncbi:MAG TPA: magnesium transporter CorA family protein [bacterium]|nr:magnesium transporter CorA family protein [bacterium]
MQKGFNVADCKVVSAGDGPCEVQVFINPDAEEKKYLINELKVDEHTLNSALDPDEISRLEFEPSHAALIFKIPKNYSGAEQLLFRVGSAGAFLFKDRLVIILSEDVPLFEGKQFGRVRSLPDLLLKIINRSTFHFLSHLKIINMLSDELEQKINASMENRYLINLFTLEKSLVYYLNAISSNGVAMDKLKHNAAKLGFTTEEAELLDDIMVENNQCLRQAEIYSNILASLMDARVSIVSNNLNILIKFLNIITIGIMVPTFVVSAFSMNVGLPLQHHPSAFWIVIGLSSISVLGFMLFWKYKKW